MADKYYEIKKILVDKIEELESIADDMSADRNVDPSKAAFAATDVYILKNNTRISSENLGIAFMNKKLRLRSLLFFLLSSTFTFH